MRIKGDISCKTSQNVAFRKFHMNRHYGALCFVLSGMTRRNNFVAVKIKETVGKRI